MTPDFRGNEVEPIQLLADVDNREPNLKVFLAVDDGMVLLVQGPDMIAIPTEWLRQFGEEILRVSACFKGRE